MIKDLPLAIAARVFEQFLCEGDKALYRAELAVFKWSMTYPKVPVRYDKNKMINEEHFYKQVTDGCNVLCMP